MAVRFRITNDSGQQVTYKVGDHSYRLPPRYTMTYTVCRLPAVRLQGDKESSQVVHPQPGSHYVIRRDQEGQIRLEKQNADTGGQE